LEDDTGATEHWKRCNRGGKPRDLFFPPPQESREAFGISLCPDHPWRRATIYIQRRNKYLRSTGEKTIVLYREVMGLSLGAFPPDSC